MKKKIDTNLTLFNTYNFPYISKKKSYKKYFVTIGIGGNIGNTKRIFDKLFLCLNSNKKFDLLMTSPLLLNPAFGYIQQNDFLNGIIQLRTNLSINDFFKIMQRYEQRFKRKRSFKDAPRTLDIDIIFFDKKIVNNKKLIIPHKSWHNRDSVRIPLQYMGYRI